jgi:hypothetical protein
LSRFRDAASQSKALPSDLLAFFSLISSSSSSAVPALFQRSVKDLARSIVKVRQETEAHPPPAGVEEIRCALEVTRDSCLAPFLHCSLCCELVGFPNELSYQVQTGKRQIFFSNANRSTPNILRTPCPCPLRSRSVHSGRSRHTQFHSSLLLEGR